jgi:hypothetical protein
MKISNKSLRAAATKVAGRTSIFNNYVEFLGRNNNL